MDGHKHKHIISCDLMMFNLLVFICYIMFGVCESLTVCGPDSQDTVSLCTLRVCDVDM